MEILSNMKKAFTLIELLVVISIIGVLTAIVVPNFMGARERASDSQRKQDMVSIKNALRTYYNDNQRYPSMATWTDDIEDYIPSIKDFSDYSYVLVNSDAFTLGAEIEATREQEIKDSQDRCGITDDNDTKYYVCAN